MRDLFTEGLLYLDLLEVFGSSHFVGDICGISQSNVYRGAHACAKVLNLDFRKREGSYSAGRNTDVLKDIRAIAQRLRARETGFLRLLPEPWSFSRADRDQATLLRVLPKTWCSIRRSFDLLDNAILDIIIAGSLDVSPLLSLSKPLPIFRPLVFGSYGVLALSSEPINLYVSPRHPLCGKACLSNLDFQAFPSPALSVDSDSVLKRELTLLGLWNYPLNLSHLGSGSWQSLFSDDLMIVPSTQRAVDSAIVSNDGLEITMLRFDTRLVNQDLLIFPLALASELKLKDAIRYLCSLYRL